jgi:glycosyltransferase involved in cell wall biosynthesis
MKSSLAPSGFRLIVPCRNCGPYIEECLESVLAQDYRDWTLLVADDSSSDDTRERVAPYLKDERIRYRRAEERLYLMGNTVDAVNLMNPGPADVVAVLDGDDKLLPGALSAVFEKHERGFDVVYTDMEISDGSPSIGRELIPNVPVRAQNWCVTQLRSFKGYLWRELDDSLFRDERGEYFRAAGDLSLYFPLIEAAGAYKTCFVPEKLYLYRVHEQCNFKSRRSEQLANNRLVRSRPPMRPQQRWFDFEIKLEKPSKHALRDMAREVRKRFPAPFSVRLHHLAPESSGDSWDAYSGLWLDEGVFFEVGRRSSRLEEKRRAPLNSPHIRAA